MIVHGLLGSSDNWRSIADVLSSDYQVISVDCRNHGRSFHHPQQSYALMAKDLAELVQAYELPQVSVIGHSMGGKVAIQFAQDYPQLLDKLIVLDMALREYADSHSHIFKAMMALDLNALDSRQAIDKALATTVKDKLARQFLLLNLTKNAADEFVWRINLDSLFCNYPTLLQKVVPEQPIPHSGAFIKGGKSDYINDADWQQIQTLFPNMKQREIPEAGHWVHADQPEQFLAYVKACLNHD